MTRNNPTPSGYNRWFLWPFVIWALLGAVLLIFFDRKLLFATVNSRHSEASDLFFHATTRLGDGLMIIIILLALFGARAFRNWWFVLAAIACNALPALLVQLMKNIADAPRPLRYFEGDSGWIHIGNGWDQLTGYHSFPSGHTAGAFSLFCFLAMLLPRRLAWLGIPFFFVALLVGYSRMYLAAHFYADVYVGSLVGTIVTLATFAFMRRMQPRFYGVNAADTTLDDDHDES